MACRFPGAADSQQYWKNILGDVYSIAPMPASRFHHARYFDPEVGAYGKSYCDLGGLIDDHPFDARAFRMPPKTLESTDIAHLWTLQVARATLENAGLDPFALQGANVGVIAGHARGSMLTADMAFGTAVEGMLEALNDSEQLRSLGLEGLKDLKDRVIKAVHDRYPKRTEDGGVGTMTSAAAGLITNTFGFTGRHMVVDAACASSLAALDIGVQGLLSGRLDAALVGGTSYSQELSVVMFAQSRALSADGSFPFDARANGFISSDGIGFLLIKRLEDAIRDGNHIRAVIRGVGGSCDGKGRALWAPQKSGQVLAMRRAYEGAGVDPATVGLIEAHATSTPLGDRTELEALQDLYGPTSSRKLPVGSVKGNIGHCREAAGIAGLAKALLAIEHQTLPPTGNFRTPSPQIPWDELHAEVLTEARPWKSQGPRRAGVNAFGIGGLNYHVILEEAPAKPQVQVPAERSTTREKIAIVGMGCKLPGALSVDAFWEQLVERRSPIRETPSSRWLKEVYHQPGERTHYRTYLAQGAFVTDFEPDWRRYKVPPKLIERNDPLQFMLLESALDAIADAGLDPKTLKGERATVDRDRVAVLMGTVFGSDFALELSLAIRSQELAEDLAEALDQPERYEEMLQTLRAPLPSINEDSSGSFSSSTLASRIAKTLDLHGPTYTIDAACASSLASLESACELLQRGVVDLAIHGGGDRAMRVQRYEAYCQFYALTRTGQPKPFDANADGFIPGEGAAVCVLKRLSDAERDGDRIYAVIEGVGSSGDGERKRLHKPSASGLSLAIERALSQASVPPEEIGFVECHGGATPLGDAAEIEALRKRYSPRSSALTVGSIKSNMGHAQGAAGILGLMKTALSLHHQKLPPMLHFERPHPEHNFGQTFRVNPDTEPYHAQGAAVSSMGLAGINYHVVLRSSQRAAPKRPEPRVTRVPLWLRTKTPAAAPAAPAPTAEASSRPSHTFVIRALDVNALESSLASLSASSLWARQEVGQGPVIAGLTALNPQDLERAMALLKKTGFTDAADPLRRKQGIFVRLRRSPASRIALMFSGQGSQYPGMMKAFFDELPKAREIAERFDAQLGAMNRAPLSQQLFSGAQVPEEIFTVQASVLLGDLMAHAALQQTRAKVEAVTGHSFGDYAALVAAGVWSLEDALFATQLRSEAILAASQPGAMLSVLAPLSRVEALAQDAARYGPLDIANINGPEQVVLSGSYEAISRAAQQAQASGLQAQRLPIPRAFHSRLMRQVPAHLAAGLEKLSFSKPKLPYLSSITGRFEDDPREIRQGLIDQLTAPVNFVAQIQALQNHGINTLIECGPRGVLTSLARSIAKPEMDIISLDDAARPGRFSLARAQTMLYSRTFNASKDPTMSQDDPSQLLLLQGEEAERLLSQDGFQEFWSRTRPSLSSLLQSLWQGELSVSSLPTPLRASDPPTRTVDMGPPPEATEKLDAKPTRAKPTAVLSQLKPVFQSDPGAPPDLAETVQAQAKIEAPSSAAPRAQLPELPSRAQVQAFLVEAMCEESGYPPELLELDADLEADLGIDTVKQAQVLGKVRDRYDLRTEETLSLRDFPTLNHVLDYVEKQLVQLGEQAASAPAEAKSAVPMVDVTARRTLTPTKIAPPKLSGASEAQTVDIRSPAAPPNGAVAQAPATRRPDITQAPLSPSPLAPRFELPKPQILHPQGEAWPVSILHLSGTSKEIGQQHGEALRDPILEVLERYLDTLGEEGQRGLQDPALEGQLTKLFDPSSLEELQGLSESLDVPLRYLLSYNLDAALLPSMATGCTQALRLAQANEGALLHLVNEDSPLLLHFRGVCPRTVQIRNRTDGPHPDRKTVFFTHAGQIAGPNGVSDEGLSITSTALLDGVEPESLPQGLLHPILVKELLERCSNLEEAQALFHRAQRVGRWSLLLSDADQDQALYLEYDGAQVLYQEKVAAQKCTTNHSVTGPAPDSSVPEHSAHRLSRATSMISGREPLSVTDAQRLLRDRTDVERDREVPHPTMNTVRRADNVMSLVIEPQKRRLFTTDRVLPPGGAQARNGSPDSTRFIALSYGRARRSKRAAPPAPQPEDAEPGPAPKNHVMRRFELRALEALRTAQSASRFSPRSVLLLGEGGALDAIAAQLQARGAKIQRNGWSTPLTDLGSFDALGLLPERTEAPWALTPADLQSRLHSQLYAPFALLQRWCQQRGAQPSTLFGVTSLGGAMGHLNAVQASPEHGGLLGLFKAIRREFDHIRVQALDASPLEPPQAIAETLLGELDAPQRLEVGLLRGKRIRLCMSEHPAPKAEGAIAWPSTWIVTGGARGVTAKLALRLAQASRPRLHLFGRTPLPETSTLSAWRCLDAAGLDALKRDLLTRMKREPGFSPLAWKARTETIDKVLEIDENLRALRATGAEVHYHPVDLTSQQDLQRALSPLLADSASEGLGILHGAGVEVAKPYDKKTEALFEATVGGKVQGLIHLLAALKDRPVSHIVGFSSVSGRFGGHGQTDYSLANEAMRSVMSAYRAHHPSTRATVFSWPAFSEVGLAARSSAKAFLERTGQKFMTPAEGADHLIAELQAGLPESEVTICERLEALDLDHLLTPEDDREAYLKLRALSPGLIGRPVLFEPKARRFVFERRLSASELFMDQHRMGAAPILPAVMGLSMLTEAARLVRPESQVTDLRIVTPLKVPEGATLLLRIDVQDTQVRLLASITRPDGVLLEPDRLFMHAQLQESAQPEPAPFVRPQTQGMVPYPYPDAIDRTPGSRMIYHGPVFRCLKGVAPAEEAGVAQLVFPSQALDDPGPLPASLLDGSLQAAGMLGRMLFERIALPAGFGRVWATPKLDSLQGAELVIKLAQRTPDALIWDMRLQRNDRVLIAIDGYRASLVPRT